MNHEIVNLKHKCAEYAYKCIYKCIAEVEDQTIKGKYLSEVKSTSAKIYGSGLMQTLTFYFSKNEPHYRKLLLHLLNWILDGETINHRTITCDSPRGDNELITLFNAMLKTPPDKMMFYTQRALMVCEWLSRFADAKLK